MLIKTVNRHLLPSPLTLDLSVMINQKRTHSVMGLDFIFGLQRPELKSRRLQETPDEKNVSTTITIIDIFWSHRREPDMTKGGSQFCVLKKSKIGRKKKLLDDRNGESDRRTDKSSQLHRKSVQIFSPDAVTFQLITHTSSESRNVDLTNPPQHRNVSLTCMSD